MSFEEELSQELKKPLPVKKEDLGATDNAKKFPEVVKFTNQIRKAYGDVIKSVLIFGSAARGDSKKTSDADVWVILDDTTTKGSEDLKKIEAQMQLLSSQLKDVHVQTHGLTEFWRWMKRGSPELFNYLRVGLVIYDTGFIKPVQRMLNAGLLAPSQETVNLKQKSSEVLLKKVKLGMKAMVFDLRYGATDACQAAIMHFYKDTPDQKKMPEHLEKLVKEKGLEPEYIEKFKKLDKMWKDLDHKTVKEATPDYLKEAFELSHDIVQRMKKLLPKDIVDMELSM